MVARAAHAPLSTHLRHLLGRFLLCGKECYYAAEQRHRCAISRHPRASVFWRFGRKSGAPGCAIGCPTEFWQGATPASPLPACPVEASNPSFFATPRPSDSLKGLLPGNLHTGRFRLGQLPFFTGVDAAPLQTFDSGAPAGHFQVYGRINAEEEPLFLRLGCADGGTRGFEEVGAAPGRGNLYCQTCPH